MGEGTVEPECVTGGLSIWWAVPCCSDVSVTADDSRVRNTIRMIAWQGEALACWIIVPMPLHCLILPRLLLDSLFLWSTSSVVQRQLLMVWRHRRCPLGFPVIITQCMSWHTAAAPIVMIPRSGLSAILNVLQIAVSKSNRMHVLLALGVCSCCPMPPRLCHRRRNHAVLARIFVCM